MSSFVHDWLEQHQHFGGLTDNRPRVRCVHPLVTLLEKLDAIARRFPRDPMEPASFIRHYEDAAQIILHSEELPPLGMEIEVLIEDMLSSSQIRQRPSRNDPAWQQRTDSPAWRTLHQAHQKISVMFWGERLSLEESCELIQSWLGGRSAAPAAQRGSMSPSA